MEQYNKLINEGKELIKRGEYKKAYDTIREAQEMNKQNKEGIHLLQEIFIKLNLQETDNKNPNKIISKIIDSNIDYNERLENTKVFLGFCNQKGSLFINELLKNDAISLLLNYLWKSIYILNKENDIIVNCFKGLSFLLNDKEALKYISIYVKGIGENFIDNIDDKYKLNVFELLSQLCLENYKQSDIDEKDLCAITKKLFMNIQKYKEPKDEEKIKRVYFYISNFVHNSDFLVLFFDTGLYDYFIEYCLANDYMKGIMIIILSKLAISDMGISKIKKSFIDFLHESNEKGFKFISRFLYANWDEAFKIISDLEKEWLLDIVDVVQLETDKSQLNLLEALSLICNQDKGREIIKNIPNYTLKKFNTKNKTINTFVTLINSKMVLNDKSVPKSENINIAKDLMDVIKSKTNEVELKFSAIESLTYLSLIPEVKELMLYDTSKDTDEKFLRKLIGLIKHCIDNTGNNSANLFGCVAIVSNIISYPKELSNEQKQMERLKKLSKGVKEKGKEVKDPLEENNIIDKRNEYFCSRVEGGISVFCDLIFGISNSNIWNLCVHSYLYMANNKENHGLLIKNGATKALFNVMKNSIKNFHVNNNEPIPNNLREMNLTCIQVLAKLCIHMDPSITFSGQKAFDLVSPFLAVCDIQTRVNKTSKKTKDILNLNELANPLQIFECLMALTNLASISPEIRKNIIEVHKGLPIIEYCLFNDNKLIQRASMECLCNLSACVEFIKYLLENSSKCGEKLHLFLAFSIHETDPQIQIAATGTLAIIAGASPDICVKIVEHERAKDLLQTMVKEFLTFCNDRKDLQFPLFHRIIEIYKSLAVNLSDTELKKFKEICTPDILNILKLYCNTFKNEAIINAFIELEKRV